MRSFVNEWNKKIYRNEDGTFVNGGMHSKELWDEFKIQSFPKFKNCCYFHVPEKWAEDVRILLTQVQSEIGDKITFGQIKEKWCRLTVYYNSTDDHARERMRELINECIERLINKGVHPPTEQEGA